MDVAGSDERTTRRLDRLEGEFGSFAVTAEETVVSQAMYADCRRAAEDGALGGTRAFVVRDGDLLLVRYAGQSDVWELPGGTIQPGRPLSDVVEGLVRDHTGLRCRPTGVVSAHEQRFVLVPDGDAVSGLWVVFDTADPGGILHPGEAVEEAAWFPTDDLPDVVAPEVVERYD